MVFVTTKISGDDWKVTVVNKAQMLEIIGDAAGVTLSDEKTIYVRTDYLDLGTIKHELFHAHFHYLCTDPNISSDNLEETFAIWFERYGEKTIEQAKEVFDSLKRKAHAEGILAVAK